MRNLDSTVKGSADPVRPPTGCPLCQNTGYKGRTGLFEWLELTGELRDLIVRRTPAWQLRQAARENGWVPLREFGLQAVEAGRTSLEEVAKVC